MSVSREDVVYGAAVWGLDAAGNIYQWNPQTSAWTQVPGSSLASTSVGANGSVWGVDSSNTVYQLAPGNYKQYPV